MGGWDGRPKQAFSQKSLYAGKQREPGSLLVFTDCHRFAHYRFNGPKANASVVFVRPARKESSFPRSKQTKTDRHKAYMSDEVCGRVYICENGKSKKRLSCCHNWKHKYMARATGQFVLATSYTRICQIRVRLGGGTGVSV